jgi:hypothetical protein
MKTFNVCIGIFIAICVSRFIPHPPNFTSLIALSFYVPALLGRKYIPAIILSFAFTDIIIGYHTGTHWTWGSVLVIGLLSTYFTKGTISRISGSLLGACIFFLITNFGVWLSGMYGISISGLYKTYFMAIPFFTYSLISTLIFSFLIELGYKILGSKFNFQKV